MMLTQQLIAVLPVSPTIMHQTISYLSTIEVYVEVNARKKSGADMDNEDHWYLHAPEPHWASYPMVLNKSDTKVSIDKGSLPGWTSQPTPQRVKRNTHE
jgi:hypothetical protein